MVKYQKKFLSLEKALHLFVDDVVEKAETDAAYSLFTPEDLLTAILNQARTEGVTLTCGQELLVDDHYLSADQGGNSEENVHAQFHEMFKRLGEKGRGLIWRNQILEEVLIVGLPSKF